MWQEPITDPIHSFEVGTVTSGDRRRPVWPQASSVGGEGAVAGRLTNRGDDTVLLTRPEQGMGGG